MRPKTAQTVIDTFTKLIDEQCSKGLSKYGTTIDEAQDENYDWNRMALEEAIDLSQYLVKENGRLQQELERKEDTIRFAIKYLESSDIMQVTLIVKFLKESLEGENNA